MHANNGIQQPILIISTLYLYMHINKYVFIFFFGTVLCYYYRICHQYSQHNPRFVLNQHVYYYFFSFYFRLYCLLNEMNFDSGKNCDQGRIKVKFIYSVGNVSLIHHYFYFTKKILYRKMISWCTC